MSRKAELQEFVQKFQQAAEAHEKVANVSTDLDTISTEGFNDNPAGERPVPDTRHNSDDYYVLMS